MQDAGVIYVATGPRHLRMALLSVDHLRAVEPDAPVTIFTDRAAAEALDAALPAGVALRLLAEPAFTWFDKIPAIRDTPYRRTVYLDADVLPIRPFFADLIRVLDVAPVAARSAGIRFNFAWEATRYPAAIPQCNTGVIAYDAERARPALERWAALRAQGEREAGGDQAIFRAALLDCGLYPSELPTAFNFMEMDEVVEPIRLVHFVVSKDVLMDPARRARRLAFLRALDPPCRVMHDTVFLNRRKNVPWSAFAGLLRYKLRIRIKKILGRRRF